MFLFRKMSFIGCSWQYNHAGGVKGSAVCALIGCKLAFNNEGVSNNCSIVCMYRHTVIRFLQKYFRTQNTYENILHKHVYNENFSDDGTPATTHQHFPSCCYLYILEFVVAYFSPAISLARAAISSINAHHTRLVKLFSFNFVCSKIILREYFFTKF